ncbi:MAG TPA: YceI family protein [Streptosporangiaceae bacterium]|nr:YceI family protein [Streptosporangiaceae bacterium]
MRRWLTWAIAGAVVVVVLAVGVPFVYIHFIEGEAPAPLSLTSPSGKSSSPTSQSGSTGPASSGSSSVTGTWQVGAGSIVGYRVNEILVGQKNVAVGRTKSVTGHLVINGTTVSAATFTVKMATIHSDESERDVQFDGRIMDVAAYPTGVFTLTHPIDLSPLPATGAVKTYAATGNLTLHGHTQPVTFTLSAERTGSSIKISGSIPVLFARWEIPNPSFGSFVTTQNHGILEFLLDFTKS